MNAILDTTMGLLTVDDVRELAASGDGTRVSFFFPTEPGGPEIGAKNSIRLKNVLREAEERLQAHGCSATEIDELLKPVRDLLPQDDFWLNPAAAFAGFLSDEGLRHYRLPMEVAERVVVGDRFFLKPLLPLLVGDERFYVLALSQKSVRLLEGTMSRIRELDLRSIPQRLQDVVGYDWEERSLQFHTAVPGGGAQVGRSMFHGHGAGVDDQKGEIEKFLRVVDKALLELLPDKDSPLVVAAAEPVLSIYRDVSKHPQLMQEGIEGNPDQKSAEELHDAAWELVEPGFLEERRQARDQYNELAGTGRATDRLRDIVPATFDGRVGTLFVATDCERWGRYDAETREVALHDEPEPADHDLLDVAAIEALDRGAKVYAVPAERIPGDNGTGIAAIYRY